MSLSRQLVRRYFDYSNQSDMAQIGTLFQPNSTYYSSQLGFFIGREAIIAMQTAFHQQYQSLAWTISSLSELKPDVIEIQFEFEGVLTDGSVQQRQGHEHILIYDGLIQHIAVGI